ncbi:GNAT family N-acetyltransferase [Clostridiaceae bacterium M8S5]|nr:GNAT family N-acetyltransferase [Clostridiaceae bacterium M8S5]
MIYDKNKQEITTNRLILRLFEEKDAKTVTELCNNYNLYKSTLNLPYPYTEECALIWIKNHKSNFINNKLYEMAIIDKETGTLYGCISLSNNKNFGRGELAYWIGEKFWGNGYATESSKAMIEFAFKVKGMHKVFARYFASNPASGRVMEKVGMIKEGILKEHIIKEGRYKDLIYYGIVNE